MDYWDHTMRLSQWVVAAAASAACACHADPADATRWIDQEFQPSSLTHAQQQTEMEWFMAVADQLKRQGIKKIRVVSEPIDTHFYE